MDGGWRIKKIHKLIAMSSVYRMSSTPSETSYEKDPVNDYFWRYNMRRLTAEEVRDSILAVNGSLNKDKMFGPSIFPKLPQEVLEGQSRPGENWGNSSEEDRARRSIYIHVKRSLPVPLLSSFDAADTDSSCPVRFNTVQPTQALGMLNSDFINKQARKLAGFARENSNEEAADQVKTILRRVMQREPTDEEISRGCQFIADRTAAGDGPDKALDLFSVIALNLNEFLFLD